MAGWPTLGILALGRLEGGQGRRGTAQFIRSIVRESGARVSGAWPGDQGPSKILSKLGKSVAYFRHYNDPPVHGKKHVRLAVLSHALLDGQEVLPGLQHHLDVNMCRGPNCECVVCSAVFTCIMTNLAWLCACFHSPLEGENISKPFSPAWAIDSQFTYLHSVQRTAYSVHIHQTSPIPKE